MTRRTLRLLRLRPHYEDATISIEDAKGAKKNCWEIRCAFVEARCATGLAVWRT